MGPLAVGVADASLPVFRLINSTTTEYSGDYRSVPWRPTQGHTGAGSRGLRRTGESAADRLRWDPNSWLGQGAGNAINVHNTFLQQLLQFGYVLGGTSVFYWC